MGDPGLELDVLDQQGNLGTPAIARLIRMKSQAQSDITAISRGSLR